MLLNTMPASPVLSANATKSVYQSLPLVPAAHVLFFDLDAKLDFVRLMEVRGRSSQPARQTDLPLPAP